MLGADMSHGRRFELVIAACLFASGAQAEVIVLKADRCCASRIAAA